MDPLTTLGAIASVLQLADAALRLSKAIYTTCGALHRASADLQRLGEDLDVFAQSLTLLHGLLHNNRDWYTDEVFLLTARILRDCHDLYGRIDAVLAKLAQRKKGLLRSLGIVVKEEEIARLLGRLRDLKGTLATVLMSLQLDLQLSLLKISCPSRILREREKPLRPETLQVLQKAQEHHVEKYGAPPLYDLQGPGIVDDSETGDGFTPTPPILGNPFIAAHFVGIDQENSARELDNSKLPKEISKSMTQERTPEQYEALTLRDLECVPRAFRRAVMYLEPISVDGEDQPLKKAYGNLSRELSRGISRIESACQFSRDHVELFSHSIVPSEELRKHSSDLKGISQQMTVRVVNQLQAYIGSPQSMRADTINGLSLLSNICQTRSLAILDSIDDHVRALIFGDVPSAPEDESPARRREIVEVTTYSNDYAVARDRFRLQLQQQQQQNMQQQRIPQPPERPELHQYAQQLQMRPPHESAAVGTGTHVPRSSTFSEDYQPTNHLKGNPGGEYSNLGDCLLVDEDGPSLEPVNSSWSNLSWHFEGHDAAEGHYMRTKGKSKKRKRIEERGKMSKGSSTHRLAPSPTPLVELRSSPQVDIDYQSPAQSPKTIWWRALETFRTAEPELATSFYKSSFPEHPLPYWAAPNPMWVRKVRSWTEQLVAEFPPPADDAESKTGVNVAGILQLVQTIDQSIGLNSAAVAWAGIVLLLQTVAEHPNPANSEMLPAIAKTAAIVARYVVMQNMYSEWEYGEERMTLTGEYEELLVELAVTVLRFLATAVEVANGDVVVEEIVNEEEGATETDGGGERIEASKADLGFSVADIEGADKRCRAFRVVVADAVEGESGEAHPAEELRHE